MTHWITGEGTKIAIPDMTTEHILNCVRLLRANLRMFKEMAELEGDEFRPPDTEEIIEMATMEEYIKAFNKELNCRGGM